MPMIVMVSMKRGMVAKFSDIKNCELRIGVLRLIGKL